MTACALDAQEPISRFMRTDFSRIDADHTIGEALVAIRRQTPGGRIVYFYVVDGENRLCGVVPTRRLLQCPPETPIANIMVRNVVALSPSTSVLEACREFSRHRLLAFPVVEDEKIVGVVDVEFYTRRVENPEAGRDRDDLFQLIGVHLSEAERASPLAAFRSRFPWLLCSIMGGVLAAVVSKFFEVELQKLVTLALFIPVVLAVAESVSIQSVSLALQVLHGQDPTPRNILTKLGRELMTGTLLGTASALLVTLVALAWLGQGQVLACLLIGISLGVTCAAVLGVAMPNVLRLLRRNPQVAAGPVALAMSDMVTLVAYFSVARWLLT